MTGDVTPQLDAALAFLAAGEDQQALDTAQAVLDHEPGNVRAMVVAAMVGHRLGELGAAIRILEEAHRLDPDLREAVVLLAFYSAFAGRLKDSLYYSKLSCTCVADPLLAGLLPADYADVSVAIQKLNIPGHVIAATVALVLEDWDRAELQCRRELALNPGNAEAWRILAQVLAGKGGLEGAAAAARAAISLAPGDAEARLVLGDLLARDGRFFEALECFRAARMVGDEIAVGSHMLTALERFPAEFDAVRAAEYAAFRAALPAAGTQPEIGLGRLRIAYLVNEHAAHAYERILMPLWDAHDRGCVDVFIFQQFMSADLPLARRGGFAAQWREVRSLDDLTLAHVIRGEGIDILIDLCGVTPHNRAALLAERPAPLVVGWLAPGVAELGGLYDAVLCDEWSAGTVEPGRRAMIPGGALGLQRGVLSEFQARERVVPALDNGFITFGARLDIGGLVSAMRHWAELLEAFPGAVLYLGGIELVSEALVERVLGIAGHFGCAGRIRFQQSQSGTLTEEVFWSKVDILLSPPYAHDPALIADALAAGIPVLGWNGGRHSGSVLSSLVGMVGHAEWCAESPDDLIALVSQLASTPDALQATHRALLAEGATARLFDQRAFATALEAACRSLAGR